MNIFQRNIRGNKATILKLSNDLKQLSVFRLIAFVSSVSFILFLANERLITLLFFVVPLSILGFAFLLNRYKRVAYLKRHTTFLKEINEQEVLRLENKLSSFPTGQVFIDRGHPYVSDLDIFGKHSLFQLINRATTESGSLCLAEWLSEPASKEIILIRQQAVKELTPKLGWRQDFQAAGMHFSNSKSDYHKLLDWLEKPVNLLPHQGKYMTVAILLSVLFTLALYYHFAHSYLSDYILHTFPLILILAVNYFVLRRVKPIAEEIIDNMHHNVKILGSYQALILKIESEKFHSEILQRLQTVFSQYNYSAALEIKKLKKILEIFQLRGTKKGSKGSIGGNLFYSVFNHFWLLDIHCIIKAEKWKNKNRLYLKSWASAVSEFEALSSLAGFSYSNPSYAFPEIKEEPYAIRFEMLGHPLINAENRVCNDFTLEGRGKIAMVTGSNMAGKSTFLRTVGTNLILALMGAPCSAKSGQVSNMNVFSSMRTEDNLEEGISSFYAELKRIQKLLELIRNGNPIFFLLDEMFKGTNSKDRHRGGFSLIRQLEELNAFGIISTHDLELAILAGKHALVTNYSFNSEIREGEMYFDYKLTLGLCTDFNASELMKRSGINILSHIEEPG